MKIYNLIFFIILICNLTSSLNASIINSKIYKKYADLFDDKILSNDDLLNYRKIFDLQEKCEWKKSNKYILKIKNKVLMGHVLSQRYLHPSCYRSEFLELTYWLKRYNDLPQAKRI